MLEIGTFAFRLATLMTLMYLRSYWPAALLEACQRRVLLRWRG